MERIGYMGETGDLLVRMPEDLYRDFIRIASAFGAQDTIPMENLRPDRPFMVEMWRGLCAGILGAIYREKDGPVEGPFIFQIDATVERKVTFQLRNPECSTSKP